MAGNITKSRDNLGHAMAATRDTTINFNRLLNGVRAIALGAPGMAIHGAASPLAKNANAFHYFAPPSATPNAPVVWGLAPVADTAAFVGTVLTATFNVFVHSLSDNGTGTITLHTRMGTAGATRAAVIFPTIPAGEVVYGATGIGPTGAGSFVGGTTALDDATVIPNAKFLDVNGASSAFTGASQIGTAAGLITK